MPFNTQHFITTLKKKKLTMAFAESITCGMAAYKLSNCIGVSDVLKGGIVCYTPEIKTSLLNVPEATMERFTCESMEVTTLLARNLRKVIKADICAAITGLASPGASESDEKPVGTIFICVYYKGRLYKRRKVLARTPVEIKRKACRELYKAVMAAVSGK